MDKNKAIEKLRECQLSADTEMAIDADLVLCDLLISLGYADVVDEYAKVSKWYV